MNWGGGIDSLFNIQWAAFPISNYFSFFKGNQNNMARCQNGNIPLVSAKKVDNGYKDFINNNGKKLFSGNIITLNNDGDGGVGIAYYQPHQTALDTHVTALIPKIILTKYQMLFIARCITMQREKFSHGYALNNTRLTAQKIMLPANLDNQPDWVLMERLMKQIELKQISKYLQYRQ